MGNNDAFLKPGLPRALALLSICCSFVQMLAVNKCTETRTLFTCVISKALSFALFLFFFPHHAIECDLGQRLQIIHKMSQGNKLVPCWAAPVTLSADGKLGRQSQ